MISHIKIRVWHFQAMSIYETDIGWRIQPKLDLSAIPAAGDINTRTDIQFTGIRRNAAVEAQIRDYITGQASLGVEFSKNDFALDVSY